MLVEAPSPAPELVEAQHDLRFCLTADPVAYDAQIEDAGYLQVRYSFEDYYNQSPWSCAYLSDWFFYALDAHHAPATNPTENISQCVIIEIVMRINTTRQPVTVQPVPTWRIAQRLGLCW